MRDGAGRRVGDGEGALLEAVGRAGSLVAVLVAGEVEVRGDAVPQLEGQPRGERFKAGVQSRRELEVDHAERRRLGREEQLVEEEAAPPRDDDDEERV